MIYLDYNATTPVHKDVLEEMLPYFSDKFANPASRTHEPGREAEKVVSDCRKSLASLFKIEPNHLVFASGATEANNLAILGLRKFLKETGRTKIITSSFEHKAVLDPLKYLADEEGFEVVYIRPQKTGYVAVEDFDAAIDEKTGLVSLMHVNNEIGTVQPVEEVGGIAKQRGSFMHVDGAQGFCKVPLELGNNIDFYTTSSHKIYGPKGIGALFINGRKAKKPLQPIVFGGGHEGGLRSGTLPTPLIVGFSKAASVCRSMYNKKGIEKLSEVLRGIIDQINSSDGIHLNVQPDKVLPTTLNIRIDGVNSEALMLRLKNIAMSNGSACTTHTYSPSHVLGAMGLNDVDIKSSLRVSLSPLGDYRSLDFVRILGESTDHR